MNVHCFFNSRKQVLVKRLYAAKDFNYWQIMQEIFIDKKKKRMLKDLIRNLAKLT